MKPGLAGNLTDRLHRVSANTRDLWQCHGRWITSDILVPFLATRVGLLLVGWFSQFLPPDPTFPYWDINTRAWLVTTNRLLDMWARWDTSWYLQIIDTGYHAASSGIGGQSNLAFFPLFPYLVKSLVLLTPPGWRSQSLTLAAGLLLTNLLLIGALIVFYRLTLKLTGNQSHARRAVWYLLIFPTSFFLSSFYSEATFLFFSLAAFYFGEKHSWAASGIMGFLAALTRPVGVLLVMPLGWLFLQEYRGKNRPSRWSLAWLGLIPAGLLIYLLSVFPLTGDFLAPLKIQVAWSRAFTSPWQTLFYPAGIDPKIGLFQQITVVFTLVVVVISFRKIPNPIYGLYAGLLILPSLLSGTLLSFARFVIVAFPVFLCLGMLGQNKNLDRWLTVIFLMLQALLMAGWSQFYPVY
ncbi:MAG: mannosyltransferase family protein [Anaerolineales bacterium]|jgi:hypothetical protein